MSDGQVIEYVKSEHAKGKSQDAIGTALLQRGVTKTQMERIKSQVEQESVAQKQESSGSQIQMREVNVTQTVADLETVAPSVNIFGKNIFNKKNLTFAPDLNVPTPLSYKLSAGDEVVIEVWGASQASIRKTISPDGVVNLDNVGPIFLSGVTVAEATNVLRRKLGEVYPGVDQEGGASAMSVTLGNIRSIQINVLGEVMVPGTYTLTSLSSVFNALYVAGGISDIGSLREINVIRNGSKIASIDVYDYLLYGKTKSNINLQEGDVVIVPTYHSLVKIEGQIKRPMYYEMKEGETVETLISYAGSYESDAYKKELTITRQTGEYNQIYTVNKKELSTFDLENGDVVSISGGLNLFDNRVTIEGQIFRPGQYEMGKDVVTVKELIVKAGGLKENAYLGRAILTRQKDDLTLETLALNLNDVFDNSSKDIKLKKNDQLSISANVIEEDLGPLLISGLVANPGAYQYAANTTVKDLIVKAGGLLSSASIARVDVARRIIDPSSTTSNSVISEVSSFSIEGGLVANGAEEFFLKPYDQVYIRRSPGYFEQRNISLNGEVLFPGNYTLENKAERITDIIKNAGGLTPQAYAQGAKILRPLSEEEKRVKTKAVQRINAMTEDETVTEETIGETDFSTVGIQLDLAMKNPGSEYDVVLKPGDQIIVPEFDNTVKILGAVMNPNTVVFKKGQSLAYYINQAGGYAENAKKKSSYIMYMNGTSSKGKNKSNLLEPGCTIIVPTKITKQGMSTGEKVALGSGVVSMASVVALLIHNLTN